MPRHAEARLAAALVGCALLLTGCSASVATEGPVPTPTHLDLSQWDPDDGNGVTLLTGSGARAAVLSAVRAEETTTMSGTFVSADGRALDVQVIASAEEAVAEFTVDGGTTRVIIVDEEAFVLPSEAIATADGLPTDVYTCAALDEPVVARWGTLLHPLQTLAEFTSDASALGQPSDGAVDLILGAEGTLGTLSIHADGPALPTRLARADPAGQLQLEFGSWGDPVDIPKIEPLALGC